MNENNYLHFLHIGKCAGTHISQICEKVCDAHGYHFIKHHHDFYLRDVPEREPYFFSIRDPVSRFRSGFYSRKRKGTPLFCAEWSKHEDIAFGKFPHANDLAESLFSEGRLGMDAISAINSIRHSSQNQINWFYRCGFFLQCRPPIWIVRQENFSMDMRVLLDRIGINSSEVEGLNIDAKTHEYDYGHTPEFSKKAVVNLNRWYSQDVEFYKMCLDWINCGGFYKGA